MTVSDLLKNLHVANGVLDINEINRENSGQYVLNYAGGKSAIEPNTGKLFETKKPGLFLTFFQILHRSFYLGDTGRIFAGIISAVMVAICLSGTILLLRRAGGSRNIFKPISGPWHSKWHAYFGRLAILPLLILAITGTYISLTIFSIIPDGSGVRKKLPESLQVESIPPAQSLAIFNDVPLADVRALTFPIPGDWFDVFILRTSTEKIYIDQGNGVILRRDPVPTSSRIAHWVYILHTGEGLVIWAIILGLASLCVPFFAYSGGSMSLKRIRAWRLKSGLALQSKAKLEKVEILILVGSESGSTWGFAKALKAALSNAGKSVLVMDIGKVEAKSLKVKVLLILTATYGDGAPPSNATQSLGILPFIDGDWCYAVLGFGDQEFPKFCAFAHEIDTTLHQNGRNKLLPIFCINQQSSDMFEQWGEQLSSAMGTVVSLQHKTDRQKTQQLSVSGIQRFNNGTFETIILSLKSAKRVRRRYQVPNHIPGDLVSIGNEDKSEFRYYSVASSAAERKLELCVKRVIDGSCSPYICDLKLGDSVELTHKSNPIFRMPNNVPVIMIGAGTGIAPFVGMIRNNKEKSAIDLFWGTRHERSDYPYKSEINIWIKDGRLQSFNPAFSQEHPKTYVQDLLLAQKESIKLRLTQGAVIMVCGGLDMAAAIRIEIGILANDLGLSLEELKQTKRYREDAY